MIYENIPTEPQWYTKKSLAGVFPLGFKADLLLNGDTIIKAKIESGYYHKGIEKTLENNTWMSAQTLVNKVSPQDAVFCELAFCLAVEEMTHTQVSRRAQVIRTIFCELNRILRHIQYFEKIMMEIGFFTAFHYLSREKEMLFNLYELLSGSRQMPSFIRIGGTRQDITEGFIERVCIACEQILFRIKEYSSFIFENEVFKSRLSRLCVLTEQKTKHFKISGPDARASGVPIDVRQKYPYSGYELVSFRVPTGVGVIGSKGDAYDRVMVRIEEIKESIQMLLYLSDNIPPGDHINNRLNKEFSVPAGESYVKVESSRGSLCCHIVADGSQKPVRIHWNVPSFNKLALLTDVLRGVSVEDYRLAVLSFDVCMVEVDR